MDGSKLFVSNCLSKETKQKKKDKKDKKNQDNCL